MVTHFVIPCFTWKDTSLYVGPRYVSWWIKVNSDEFSLEERKEMLYNTCIVNSFIQYTPVNKHTHTHKLAIHITYKSRWVIILDGFGISKSLQDGIGL